MKRDEFRHNIRELRSNQTDAENKLWMLLRSRRFANYKFRRQQPIDHYIADFCCLEKRLIVEVDGGQHALQMEYDEARTKFLKDNGFRVIRFWNNQVLQESRAVIDAIFEAVSTPHPPFGHLLPQGEKERRE